MNPTYDIFISYRRDAFESANLFAKSTLALLDNEKEYERQMAINTIKLVKKLGWKIVK